MEDRYLFKAKHFKKWHIGNIVKEPDGLYIRDIKENVMTYINDESTICQCTGLKDKNGNLIWENDIVELFGHRGVIKYACGGFGIEYRKILIGKKYKPILCVLQGVKTFYMLAKTIITYHCGKSIGILMMRMIR